MSFKGECAECVFTPSNGKGRTITIPCLKFLEESFDRIKDFINVGIREDNQILYAEVEDKYISQLENNKVYEFKCETIEKKSTQFFQPINITIGRVLVKMRKNNDYNIEMIAIPGKPCIWEEIQE